MAILAGSALIALSVYLGLRARPAAVVPSSGVAAATADGNASTLPGALSAPSAAPAPTPPSGAAAGFAMQMGGANPAGASDVDRDVLAALESQRASLVDKCWKPMTSGDAKVEPANYDVDLSFDEAGREVARGLSERKGATTTLTQCIYKNSPSLLIPSRRSRVHTRVHFTLP